MKKEILKKPNFTEELLHLLRTSPEAFWDRLSDYHDNDIAGVLELLTEAERKKLYSALGAEKISDALPYIEDVEKVLGELGTEYAAKLLSLMDPDDAVDVLEEMDASAQERIVPLLDAESGQDVRLILSYPDDEIGSKMTTNFVMIPHTLSIRQAMRELVRQAGEHDNISTIYATDSEARFYGAIDLKDLITARDGDSLERIIRTSYPYVYGHDQISDCLELFRDYAEDSIPVLNERNSLIGIITAQGIVEVVDDALGEDYARLAGLTAEEDLKEPTLQSIRKRLPWLVVLLFLGIGVSSVVGVFETVVAALPIAICFQSLVLDMAGNAGTQSLAVTIRVLMDESLTGSQKVGLLFKELKVGAANGAFLGSLAFFFIGLYVSLLKRYPAGIAFFVSGCVGVALLVAIVVSSMVGTLVPLFFHRIKIDPAVASGPLITTINDLVAVVSYYGLVWLLLIHMLRITGV